MRQSKINARKENKPMAKVLLSKQVTRDFSQYMVQWWRAVMHERFRKFFSASYTEYISIHDGHPPRSTTLQGTQRM